MKMASIAVLMVAGTFQGCAYLKDFGQRAFTPTTSPEYQAKLRKEQEEYDRLHPTLQMRMDREVGVAKKDKFITAFGFPEKCEKFSEDEICQWVLDREFIQNSANSAYASPLFGGALATGSGTSSITEHGTKIILRFGASGLLASANVLQQ